MHQNRRQSPPSSPRAVPARTDHWRPEELRPLSSPSDGDVRGLGIERQRPEEDSTQDAVVRLNRLVQNYFAKAALTILHTRVDLPPAYSRETNAQRVNKWFNIELDETDVLKDVLSAWRNCHFLDNRPPPMVIETFLDTRQLSHRESLVIIDEDGKRCDVSEALSALHPRNHRIVVLERWRLELGDAPDEPPDDLGAQLPVVYKHVTSLIKSFWTYSHITPVWKFLKRRVKGRFSPVLTPCYRVFQGTGQPAAAVDSLTAPLYETQSETVENYSFAPTATPAGALKVSVTFRKNCDFRVDDSESILSSRFMGAHDGFFKPSLASEETVRASDQGVGSLPLDKGGETPSDHGQTYGSLSTFHQVGPPRSTSPLSALRAARERASSPSSPSRGPSSPKFGQATHQRDRSGGGEVAGGDATTQQRRPSFSLQAFKAPPLSASPVPSHSRNVSEPPPKPTTGDKAMPPPSMAASASRRPQDQATAQESALASSTSASPKTAQISKYSSSFSHRRGRLSSGGASKGDEDNNSSGRVSASSSTAQPSSGILAEAGGPASSGSWHADDENISDFLKMLDLKKDLLSPEGNTSAADTNTRRTAAALTRFHKMKDANAALSESMSSSTLLQKSSTSSSRQLPNLPPMIPPTSMSTSSSPGKAMSPHTPHTPAIPSRLSSNSIVDYSRDSSGNRRRASRQSRESPVQEAYSGEPTEEPAASSSIAIDIPTSPPFIPDFRRASSAAQRRRDPAPEDELGEFYFGATRSVSLGVEDRSPLSLSALLRQQQEQDNHPYSSTRPQQQHQQPPSSTTKPREAPSESQSRRGSSSTSQPYQPRFPHHQGRGSVGRSPSRGSVSSSLGRGGNVSTVHPKDREREPGNEGGSSSGASTATDGRRRGSHRFSYGRPTNFDEDEPLLFTMSDFGSSRRSLEEARREPPGGRDAPGPSRQNDGGRGGGPSGGFSTWQ